MWLPYLSYFERNYWLVIRLCIFFFSTCRGPIVSLFPLLRWKSFGFALVVAKIFQRLLSYVQRIESRILEEYTEKSNLCIFSLR